MICSPFIRQLPQPLFKGDWALPDIFRTPRVGGLFLFNEEKGQLQFRACEEESNMAKEPIFVVRLTADDR